jgi:hypothetical protein
MAGGTDREGGDSDAETQRHVARDAIAAAMKKSAADFLSLVWPVASELVGGGELHSVESAAQADTARQFDMLAGIDAWQIRGPFGIRGIASRVQYVHQPDPDSFTIRYRRSNGAETEYAKRTRAIREADEGYLFPHWTVQAFVTKKRDRLLSVAAIKTVALFAYTARALDYKRLTAAARATTSSELGLDARSMTYFKKTREKDATFIVVPWRCLDRVRWDFLGCAEPAYRTWYAPDAKT